MWAHQTRKGCAGRWLMVVMVLIVTIMLVLILMKMVRMTLMMLMLMKMTVTRIMGRMMMAMGREEGEEVRR